MCIFNTGSAKTTKLFQMHPKGVRIETAGNCETPVFVTVSPFGRADTNGTVACQSPRMYSGLSKG